MFFIKFGAEVVNDDTWGHVEHPAHRGDHEGLHQARHRRVAVRGRAQPDARRGCRRESSGSAHRSISSHQRRAGSWAKSILIIKYII